MKRTDRLLFAVAGVVTLSLTACVTTHRPIKNVADRAPSELSAAPEAAQLRLGPVSVRLNVGEQIGEDGQGPGCLVHPGNTVSWRPEMQRPISQALTVVLLDEVKKAKYASMFDASVERAGEHERDAGSSSSTGRPEIRLVGQVTQMTLNTCYPGSVSPLVNLARGGKGDAYGSAYVRTEWMISLGSSRGGVHRLSTEGSYTDEEPKPGNVRILAQAFAVAVRNLLADAQFRNLAAGNAARRTGGPVDSAARRQRN